MTNFKERQIKIREKEIEIQNETHQLLYDMLSSMDSESLDRLNGYQIDDYYEILSINKDELFLREIEDFEGETLHNYGLEYLTQVQQKELIDHIILYLK